MHLNYFYLFLSSVIGCVLLFLFGFDGVETLSSGCLFEAVTTSGRL